MKRRDFVRHTTLSLRPASASSVSPDLGFTVFWYASTTIGRGLSPGSATRSRGCGPERRSDAAGADYADIRINTNRHTVRMSYARSGS